MVYTSSKTTFSNPWDDCHHFETNCYIFGEKKDSSQAGLSIEIKPLSL